MAALAEKLLDHGIRLRSYGEGSQKITCPRCSHTRRKKTDRCLSVTITGERAVWKCHHCDYFGAVGPREREVGSYRRPRGQAHAKPTRRPDPVSPAILAWFEARGISEATVQRNRIGATQVRMPGIGAETDCIAFPYYRDGELVNIKFRALASKHFSQIKGAEKILYGLGDLAGSETAIIVEGECDKLAFNEAGIWNVISVPDGAPHVVKAGDPDPGDAKFEYLANCTAQLDPLKRIVLAVDADGPGQALAEELARRLGRDRCWRVRWPDSGDAPCKDANQVLSVHGREALRECIDLAEPYPIAGLHSAYDFGDETIALYRDGLKRGHSTGWPSLDELMTIREGDLSVVTGIPNSGKSEFIDAIAVNLAKQYDWRFAICSFENPPPEHIAKLAEKYLGLPFWDEPTSRMSETDLRCAMDWVADHFYLIRADKEAPTIDWILDTARAAVMRHGIRGLVIDPYNEIEHKRPPAQTETEYVSQILGKVKRFAQSHGVHVWFVAHPAKMQRIGLEIPPPNLYDISGSANWANKADVGVAVHRDPTGGPTRTNIYTRKIRSKAFGSIGMTSLRYEPSTGRFFESEQTITGEPRW